MVIAVGEVYSGVFSVSICPEKFRQQKLKPLELIRLQMNSGSSSTLLERLNMIVSGVCPSMTISFLKSTDPMPTCKTYVQYQLLISSAYH